MGDEKQYSIQIKGTAYKFKPIPPDDIQRVVMVINMGASVTKPIKALTRVLSVAAGVEQWDEITDRYIAGELTEQDFTSKLFETLIKRQGKDAKAAQPADDAE